MAVNGTDSQSGHGVWRHELVTAGIGRAGSAPPSTPDHTGLRSTPSLTAEPHGGDRCHQLGARRPSRPCGDTLPRAWRTDPTPALPLITTANQAALESMRTALTDAVDTLEPMTADALLVTGSYLGSTTTTRSSPIAGTQPKPPASALCCSDRHRGLDGKTGVIGHNRRHTDAVGALLGLIAAVCITLTEFFAAFPTRSDPASAAAASPLPPRHRPARPLRRRRPDGQDLALGACSGVDFGIGIAAYLLGVRVSSSAVIGPTVAALATLIPFLYAAVVEDLPPVLAWLGAVTVVTGLLFVTMGGDVASNVRGGLPIGIVSGLGYGIGTAFLVDVTDDAGVWPVASQRGMAFITIIVWAMLRKRPLLPPVRFAPQSTAAGLFGGLSTALLLAGFTFNAAATSVTASLFQATSVAAGRLFFGDAVNLAQVIGLVIVIIGKITIVIA